MPFSRLRKQDQRTLPRSFAATEGIEMERVTRVRKALGATVNDLMMAVIAAGIESYVQDLRTKHGGLRTQQSKAGGSAEYESSTQRLKPSGWSSRSGAIRFRAVTMADLRSRTRKGPPVWGNKLGISVISLPISLHPPPLHPPPPPLPTAAPKKLAYATSASLPQDSDSSTAALPHGIDNHVIDIPPELAQEIAVKVSCGGREGGMAGNGKAVEARGVKEGEGGEKEEGSGKEARRVQQVRRECGQKKVSWEAHLTNLYARLALALLGRKAMAWLSLPPLPISGDIAGHDMPY
ncbi:unnamed protein product [Closterium sp. Naga37s-1]|nr:unnamed protein product [Closterium sp. Naga37s-1]